MDILEFARRQVLDEGFGLTQEQALQCLQLPDDRVDALSALYSPKKTIYAEVSFTDVAAGTSGQGIDRGLIICINEYEGEDKAALVECLDAEDFFLRRKVVEALVGLGRELEPALRSKVQGHVESEAKSLVELRGLIYVCFCLIPLPQLRGRAC